MLTVRALATVHVCPYTVYASSWGSGDSLLYMREDRALVTVTCSC